MQSSHQTKTASQRLVHQIGGSEAWHVYHLVMRKYIRKNHYLKIEHCSTIVDQVALHLNNI